MHARFVTGGLLVLALGWAATAGYAAQDEAAPYLGKWNITIQNVGGSFPACWLKVERKDGALDARLLWRWGSVTPVKSVKLVDGELQWVRPEWWEDKQKSVDTTYQAKLQNGQLVGQVKMPWGELHQFTGVRAIDKVDLAGRWVAVAAEDPDQIERTLVFKQDGGTVSGAYDDGSIKAEVKGAKLDGNKISFEIVGEEFRVQCRAVVEGDRMRGTYDTGEDSGTFAGERRRRLGEKIVLLDGTSLNGWKSRDPKRAEPRWAIKDGYVHPLPGATDIYTDRKFEDFQLHVEYCFPPEEKQGNSGVYVRGRYEVQLADDYGQPPSPGGCGAIYSRVVPTKNVTKPPHTWQTMDITMAGNWITVKHNGETVVDNAFLEGITGGGLDADDSAPGPIMLQAHGEGVNFRKVEIVPLLK